MKTTLIRKPAFVTAAVLIVSAYFITGLLLYSSAQYNEVNINNLKESLVTLGRLTPPAVFSNSGEAAEWSSQFGKNTGSQFDTSYRITLIRRNGQVAFDTGADTAAMEDHLARPEFQDAVRGGIGAARRKSATMGVDYIYAAIGIRDSDSRIAGVLRLSRPVPGFFSRLAGSAFPFLAGGFLLILASLAGLYLLFRNVLNSMEVSQAAELREKLLLLEDQSQINEGTSRQLRAVLSSMFDGVMVLDSGLYIILANPRLCVLFGFNGDQNDLKGKPLLELCRSAELEENVRNVLETGQPAEFNLTRYATGGEQHLRVYAVPMKPGFGQNGPDLLVVLGDIGRLVKLEQVRKDFADNVSHELRTPIQVIKGFTENILDSSLDDKEQIRHFAGIIYRNAQLMENLTHDLLTLVSLEDDNGPRILMEETLLAPLISEAVSMVEITAKKKNITIECTCPEDLKVKVYGPYIIQALVNLLDNGVKYSNADSRVKVKAYTEAEYLFIEVKDKGKGIPAEHLGRIFERFYRLDRARSRETGKEAEKGTGLGLAIVRHIAMLHHGNVDVESHAGEGSTFKLSLPIEPFQNPTG